MDSAAIVGLRGWCVEESPIQVARGSPGVGHLEAVIVDLGRWIVA